MTPPVRLLSWPPVPAPVLLGVVASWAPVSAPAMIGVLTTGVVYLGLVLLASLDELEPAESY